MRIGRRAYQVFRWWDIGTGQQWQQLPRMSVSGFPMVGYRNSCNDCIDCLHERIRFSDGGISEPSST